MPNFCSILLTFSTSAGRLPNMVQGPIDAVAARVLARQRHEVIVAEVRRRGRGSRQRTGDAPGRQRHDGAPRSRPARRSRAAPEGARRRDAARRTHDRRAGLRGQVVAQHGREARHRDGGRRDWCDPAAAIGITAGTTTWQLAYHIVDIADLTVVTNSVRVAEVLASIAAPRSHRRADRRHPHTLRRAGRSGRDRDVALAAPRRGLHGRARHHRTSRVQHAEPHGGRDQPSVRRAPPSG